MYYGFAEPVIITRPRNAHRRPLIPPLAILFSSLFAPSVPPRGVPLFPGPDRPLTSRARSCPFFSPLASYLRLVGASSRHVTSRRCAHFCNRYQLSQLGPRTQATSFFSFLFPFSSSPDQPFDIPSSRFSIVLLYLRVSLARKFRRSSLQIDR